MKKKGRKEKRRKEERKHKQMNQRTTMQTMRSESIRHRLLVLHELINAESRTKKIVGLLLLFATNKHRVRLRGSGHLRREKAVGSALKLMR